MLSLVVLGYVVGVVVISQSHRVNSDGDSQFSRNGRKVMTLSGESGRASASSGVFKVVSVPDAFLFFVNAERYTGDFATSLTDLLRILDRVPLESIEFHFQRGDFEKWVGRTLGDVELADRLRQIDRRARGEELRVAIKEAIQKRLADLHEST